MRTAPILISLFALAPLAAAGGLDRSLVPAGAQWVAHLDVEALVASKTWTELQALDEKKELVVGLQQFAQFGQLSPLEDLTGLTVFSSSKAETKALVVLSGGARLQHVWDSWIEGKHPAPTTIGSAQAFALGEENALAYVHKSADGQRCTVVLGTEQAALGAAIEVVEGRGTSLAAAAKPALAALPLDHSILFFAASGDLGGEGALGNLPGFEPMSNVGKLARGVRFDLGEAQGKLSATVRLETRTNEDARKVQQVVQGIVAMLSLAAEEPEQGAFLSKLSSALTVRAADSIVELSFAYDVAELVKELKSMDEFEKSEKAEKPEKAEKGANKKDEKPQPK